MVPGLECYIWSSAFLTGKRGKPQKQTPRELHPGYPRLPSLYLLGANAPTRCLRFAPLGKPCQLFLPPQLAWIIGNKRLTRNVQHMDAHLLMSRLVLERINCTFNIMRRHSLFISIQPDVTCDPVIANSLQLQADSESDLGTPLSRCWL